MTSLTPRALPRWPVFASLTVVTVTLAAVLAPGLIAPGDPLAISPADAFLPPSLMHPFGTDESGRDVLTRVVHGARASVGIGLAATLIGAGIGAVAGFAAGLGPRLADRALARLFEVLFALPTLVLALLFISVLGGGIASSVLAIGIATIPGYARMLRARARSVAASGYVEWARLDGVRGARLFARHIAPNTLWPLAAAATLGIGQAIIWVASLGFLGLGAAPPEPEWGAMLNAGRNYLGTAWWMTVFPGLAIVTIASALTSLGRALGAPRQRTRPRRSRMPRRTRGRTSGLTRPTPESAPVLAGEALRVTDLTVTSPGGEPVLHGVSFALRQGECLAIVGESGAGKSVLARTLLGLTQADHAWRVDATALHLDGSDLTHATRRGWRRTRGTGIALILQDPLQALDPLRTLEAEVGETLAVHGMRRTARRARVIAALDAAGLDRAAARLRQRPFELSGGMRQRALIASALAGSPAVVVADEPTTALDPITAQHVHGLLRAAATDGAGLLLISHDLASVSRIADRVAVLHRGRIIETGTTEAVLTRPTHAVTRELVAAAAPGAPATSVRAAPGDPLIVLRGASLRHSSAVDSTAGLTDVTLTVRRGETLGVVGASGAGKTTLGHVLAGATRLQHGTYELADPACRIRTVPQDPLATFDPRWRVRRIIEASLVRGTAADLLRQVGLDTALLERHPAQLSGGQRQRVAIARAIAADPDVLVCDEPVSALDATTQLGILTLLRRLQQERALSIVFISHDVAAVRSIAHRVIVMSHGRILEATDHTNYPSEAI